MHKACWSQVRNVLCCNTESECISTASTSRSQLPLVPFHCEKVNVFSKSAVRWNIFQTFYPEINCLMASQTWSPLWTICRNICFTGFFIMLIHCVCFVGVISSAGPLLSVCEKLSVTSVLHNWEQNHSSYWTDYIKNLENFSLHINQKESVPAVSLHCWLEIGR